MVNFNLKDKSVWEILGLIMMILGIVIVLVATIQSAIAWNPDEFCQEQANFSIPEYLSCKSYFESLNHTATNNITIINNTIVVNQTVYQNLSTSQTIYVNTTTNSENIDLSLYAKKEDTYTRREYDLITDNMKLNLLSDFKNELVKGDWLSVTQTINYTSDVDVSHFVTEEDMQDYVNKAIDSQNSPIIEQKNDQNMIYFLGAIIIASLIYFFVVKKKPAYDNPNIPPVYNTTPRPPTGLEENQRFQEAINHQSKALEKLKLENENLKEIIQKINQKINEE